MRLPRRFSYFEVTPSMEQDFAQWRRQSKHEDLPALEKWIEALKRELRYSKS